MAFSTAADFNIIVSWKSDGSSLALAMLTRLAGGAQRQIARAIILQPSRRPPKSDEARAEEPKRKAGWGLGGVLQGGQDLFKASRKRPLTLSALVD